MNTQTLKDNKKKLLRSILATTGNKLVRDSLKEIDFVIDQTITHTLEQVNEVLEKRKYKIKNRETYITQNGTLSNMYKEDDYNRGVSDAQSAVNKLKE